MFSVDRIEQHFTVGVQIQGMLEEGDREWEVLSEGNMHNRTRTLRCEKVGKLAQNL